MENYLNSKGGIPIDSLIFKAWQDVDLSKTRV